VRLDEGAGDGLLVQNERKWSPTSCVSTREGSGGEGVLALHYPVSWAMALALFVSVVHWCWCWRHPLVLVLSIGIGIGVVRCCWRRVFHWCWHCLLVSALSVSVGIAHAHGIVVVPIPTCNPPHEQRLVRLEGRCLVVGDVACTWCCRLGGGWCFEAVTSLSQT
jgi:hypothetical protein